MYYQEQQEAKEVDCENREIETEERKEEKNPVQSIHRDEKKLRIDPKVNWLAMQEQQPAISNLLRARNVFSLIYTCLVGFFFPICDLTLSSSYHKYRFAFSLLSFKMRTHNWRHAFTRNVQLSLNDTWLFIILVQIIDSTSAEGREKKMHTHTHTS